MNRTGFALCLVILMAVCAVSVTSRAGGLVLIAWIERRADSILAPTEDAPQAIVVLTGGEPRTREAVRRYRETGLPILSSGGDGEAALLKQILQNKFGVPVRWTEDQSLNTEQNALYCAEILANENIKSIILVTDALHMWRAAMMFSDRGLRVTAAAVRYSRPGQATQLKLRDFLPSKEGLALTKSAMHELLGVVWYRSRHISGFI